MVTGIDSKGKNKGKFTNTPSHFPSLIYSGCVVRTQKSPTCYKNLSVTKINENFERKTIGTPQLSKLKKKKNEEVRKAATEHRVLCVTIFRSQGLRGQGQERGPQGSEAQGSGKRQGRFGSLHVRQLGSGGGGLQVLGGLGDKREGGSPAGGKGGMGAIPTRRTRPGPLSPARGSAPGSRGCARTRPALSTAGLPSRSPASSGAPGPRQGTHPGLRVANSRRLPRRQQRRGRRTPGVPAEPSPRLFALLPRGAASRAPIGCAALESAVGQTGRAQPPRAAHPAPMYPPLRPHPPRPGRASPCQAQGSACKGGRCN